MRAQIIYLVGDQGPEHYNVHSVHKTHRGALKSFEKVRIELFENAQSSLESCKTRNDGFGIAMYAEIVKRLSNKDPRTIDNYPQETPFIHKRKLQA